jgi:hypothetical protein
MLGRFLNISVINGRKFNLWATRTKVWLFTNPKKRGGPRRFQHIGCAKVSVSGDTLLCCQAHQEIEVIELGR